jgi:hypothetical protein
MYDRGHPVRKHELDSKVMADLRQHATWSFASLRGILLQERLK